MCLRSTVLVAPFCAMLLAPVPQATATEEPEFQLLAAETLVTGADFEDAGDIAFGRLFRYITGNNRVRAEIAMTAPVIQQPGATDGYRVAFIVPAEYTRETATEPLDPAVHIVAPPARSARAVAYRRVLLRD